MFKVGIIKYFREFIINRCTYYNILVQIYTQRFMYILYYKFYTYCKKNVHSTIPKSCFNFFSLFCMVS